MSEFIDSVLQKLAIRIRENRYEPLETDGLEIKPVPASTGEWNEICKSTNAFLNTRGGILLMGIKETGQGENKRYLFSGYREEVEPKTKEVPNQ